jgi:hypothetical protein
VGGGGGARPPPPPPTVPHLFGSERLYGCGESQSWVRCANTMFTSVIVIVPL